MEPQSSPLGDAIARLRGTAQAEESCAWSPYGIHALIMACLVRLFARLEQIFQLWESGNLPPPPIRAPSFEPAMRATRPPVVRSSGHRRARHRRPASRRVTARGPARGRAAARPRHAAAPPPARRILAPDSRRIRAARAPPSRPAALQCAPSRTPL
ncbi:MAG: hypothetical protein IT555_15360 [Acetobacteraceae bacterium]|nr:hypothetical protein [Acetobacteraceae bacterium]